MKLSDLLALLKAEIAALGDRPLMHANPSGYGDPRVVSGAAVLDGDFLGHPGHAILTVHGNRHRETKAEREAALKAARSA